jgi:hypothetical protein
MSDPPAIESENFDAKALCDFYLKKEKEYQWRKDNDTEIQIDSQEFVAFQKIPFFGAHFYFAFSPNEPIQTWPNFKKISTNKKLKILRELQKICNKMI